MSDPALQAVETFWPVIAFHWAEIDVLVADLMLVARDWATHLPEKDRLVPVPDLVTLMILGAMSVSVVAVFEAMVGEAPPRTAYM
jgi:hypothetical protein